MGLQHGAASGNASSAAASLQSGSERKESGNAETGSDRRDGFKNHRAGEKRSTEAEGRPDVLGGPHRATADGLAAAGSCQPLDGGTIEGGGVGERPPGAVEHRE